MYEAVFYDQRGRIVRTPRATGQTSASFERALKAMAKPDWRLFHVTHIHRHGQQKRLLGRVLAREISLETWLAAGGRPDTARVVGRYLRRMAWAQQLTQEAA